MQQIDEASRRWDDFQGGRPIELPDGQTWWFCTPEPKVRLGIREGDRLLSQIPSWAFGADADPLLDEMLAQKFASILAKRSMAITDDERSSASLEAVWFLLARNYQITPDEFEGIMLQGDAWGAARQNALGFELGELLTDVCDRALAEVA